MPAEFKAIWEVLVAAALVIGWGFRLEARANAAHARIDMMEKQRSEDKEASDQSRAEIRETLAEMRAESKEMRADIKALLREHGK